MVKKHPTISDTVALVTEKFSGLKYGGRPYTDHLFLVAALVGSRSEDHYHVALLHDIIEDTDVTWNDLIEMGYSYKIASTVEMLTRHYDETYEDYIDSLIATNHDLALDIKEADLKVNLNAVYGMISGVPAKASLYPRYIEAITRIRKARKLW